MISFIVCIEDRYGISFNKRLIGRDKFVDEYLEEKLTKSKVFADQNYINYVKNCRIKNIKDQRISDLVNSKEEITIFCSSKESLEYLENADEIVIFYWNRRYPADLYLDYDIVANDYCLSERVEDIEGSTHILTKEIWRKKDGKEKKL